MPKVKANGITLNYEQQGSGEPLILIPYLSADNMCYAFQVAEYAKHFTCISLDLRGTGESDKPDDRYSIETLADDVAAFMDAAGIGRAHVTGLSLGAGIGLWLAAKHPDKVKTLSVHSGWHKTDAYVETVLKSWQVMVRAFDSVPTTVIEGMFPWCFTPEFYVTKSEVIETCAAFVRSRPPMSVEEYIRQSDAVISHDVEAQLKRITAPTQITFGRHDHVTSLRFAEPLQAGIRNSELCVFETASHAPIYEVTEEFNQKTLEFLQRHAAQTAAA